MKAIIYTGISLFSIASVYGINDYYQAQKKGVLDNLYKDEEVSIVKDKEQEIERTISAEEYSRGKIEEPATEKTAVNAIATQTLTETKKIKKAAPVKVVKKIPKPVVEERNITLSEFSRGSLRQRRNIIPPTPIDTVDINDQ